MRASDQRTRRAAAGPQGRSLDEQEALDEEFGTFVAAAHGRMLRLLRMPAPNLEAVVLKIRLIARHQVWEMTGGEECLAWLEVDARRLAAERG